jgi:formate dehydrogenase major subunit
VALSDEASTGSPFLHAPSGRSRSPARAPLPSGRARSTVDAPTSAPAALTTGRCPESFNTGVQSRSYPSPLRAGESIDLSPADAASYGVVEGEEVRVSSRRGAVTAPVRIDPGLRAGLVFMTFHFPDEVDTNALTIDATDPKSGTAEFKASAVRIDKLTAAQAR